jgi:ATP-dependent protease HslVU (ClpYQ) peptidase subunit
MLMGENHSSASRTREATAEISGSTEQSKADMEMSGGEWSGHELGQRLDAMDVIDKSRGFVVSGIADVSEGDDNCAFVPSGEDLPEGEDGINASARLVNNVLTAIEKETGLTRETILKECDGLVESE